jgi:hypothetical protein
MKAIIASIDEEFQKAQVKGFTRTKKGKLERVKSFERIGGARSTSGWMEKKQALAYFKDSAWEGVVPAIVIAKKFGQDTVNELISSGHLARDKEHSNLLVRTKKKLNYGDRGASSSVVTKKTWTDTEKQGPGRAYWFDSVEDAKAFAKQKKAKGHAILDNSESSKYVWISTTTKNHSGRTKEVMMGIDPTSGF